MYPSDLIHLTGHSLGGAVTTLFALYLMEHEPSMSPASVYTFGCPRIGNKEFSLYCDSFIGDRLFRFMNHTDFIPDLPPQSFGYCHTGILVLCTSDKEYHIGQRMEENKEDEFTRFIQFVTDPKQSHVTYLGHYMPDDY